MTFDVKASQDKWVEQWGEDPPRGNVATELLYENEKTRVWNLTLEPGQVSPLHTHENDYMFIVIETARVLTRFPDGTTSDDTDAVGDAIFVPLDDNGRTHTLANIDDKRYVNRVVEFLA